MTITFGDVFIVRNLNFELALRELQETVQMLHTEEHENVFLCYYIAI